MRVKANKYLVMEASQYLNLRYGSLVLGINFDSAEGHLRNSSTHLTDKVLQQMLIKTKDCPNIKSFWRSNNKFG